MKEGMNLLRCGSCGDSQVKLYTSSDGEITAECSKCQSETDLKVSQKIYFDWGDKGDGVLCVFDK